MAAEELIEVWNYAWPPLAEVGRYRLDQNGIHAEIFGAKVDGYYLTAIGGVSLMVRKADFESAKRILASVDEVEEEVVAKKDEISAAALYCSNCHSKNVRSREIRYGKSPPFPLDILKKNFGYKRLWRCRDCGKTWRTR